MEYRTEIKIDASYNKNSGIATSNWVITSVEGVIIPAKIRITTKACFLNFRITDALSIPVFERKKHKRGNSNTKPMLNGKKTTADK